MRDAYPVYALSLLLVEEDIQQLAFESITGGGNDKGTDICYLDLNTKVAFIGQSYVAESWTKPQGPETKAEDIATSINWLLHPDHSKIPSRIRAKAVALQEAIAAKEIDRIHLMFVHNAKESKPVGMALDAVAHIAKALIGGKGVDVSSKEYGLGYLQQLYSAMSKDIAVEDKILLTCEGYFGEAGTQWFAVSTTALGSELRDLYQKYGDLLYTANLRGFMNTLSRESSINSGIMETVKSEPGNLWVYNNGITILTRKLTEKVKGKQLELSGISIINGAQTTGVIGHASQHDVAKVRVLCRIVECTDDKLVNSIVTFNNTQNTIRPSDRRSRDRIQTSLRTAFAKVGVNYVHRRSGPTRVPPGSIEVEIVAPYLAAFHGDFQTAARRRRAIFEEDETYARVFPTHITAQHVYLVQSLADAISITKQELQRKSESTEGLLESETKALEVLNVSTAKFFVLSVVGALAEQILNKRVTDLFGWIVRDERFKPDRSQMVIRWVQVVETLLPLIVQQVSADPYGAMRSAAAVRTTAGAIGPILSSLKKSFDAALSPVRDATIV